MIFKHFLKKLAEYQACSLGSGLVKGGGGGGGQLHRHLSRTSVAGFILIINKASPLFTDLLEFGQAACLQANCPQLAKAPVYFLLVVKADPT